MDTTLSENDYHTRIYGIKEVTSVALVGKQIAVTAS